MKKATVSASSVKILLISILAILVIVAVGGFYYAQDWFSKYAANITSVPSSSANEMSPTQLNELRIELIKYQPYIDKVASITAPQGDYNSAIQQDLNTYASATGTKITNFGPSNAQPPSSLAALPTGIRTSYISISIQNPIPYNSLLQFINAIETNLPKMRLTGIGVKRVESPAGYVNVDPMIIEIYLR